ncbi:MAG: DUF4474 domain-containing protein [Lachnospiraceae bacterium]
MDYQDLIISLCSVVAASLLLYFIIRVYRIRHFKPTEDKTVQHADLNKLTEPFGFLYQEDGDFFYSTHQNWQRSFGYCRLYDETAPLINLITDSEPIPFDYNGKHWLIEFCKGQYGMCTGAEVGIYNTALKPLHTASFRGYFYESITDEEMLRMSFTLKKGSQVLLKRSGVHWGLTGFLLGSFASPKDLTMEIRITFPNHDMMQSFVYGLRTAGYSPCDFNFHRCSVYLNFTKPHAARPYTLTSHQEQISQASNEAYCTLYQNVTKQFQTSADKLEYLQTDYPELFSLAWNSLYRGRQYDSYRLIERAKKETYYDLSY